MFPAEFVKTYGQGEEAKVENFNSSKMQQSLTERQINNRYNKSGVGNRI